MSLSLYVRFLLVLVWVILPCRATEVATEEFLSRPDIIPPAMNVVTIDNATVSEGHMFLAPEMHSHTNFTRTMYIYNSHGGMVWSGHAFNIPTHRITIFEGCKYQGAMHICVAFYDGGQAGGKARSSWTWILDSSYNKVQTIAPSYVYNETNSTLTQGLHEFRLVGDASSALVSSMDTVERPTVFEDCPGIPTASFITTCFFSEISTDGLNTTLFEWNALDHVNVSESVTCPGYPNSGSGSKDGDGVDYFHINSVDKNADNDYLVSGRHTNTVYKIAGERSASRKPPGTIIWRLGGKYNDFELKNSVDPTGAIGFNFSFQHHARFTPKGVRLFDNANSEIAEAEDTAVAASAVSASGMDIDIDETRHTATLVYQAIAPSGKLAASQGSHQELPNGNHFIGMGSENEIFERTASGAVAFDALMGGKGLSLYRAIKQPWMGYPAIHELRLFAYAHNATAPTAYYASWNGATNVTSYRISVSNSSSSTEFQPMVVAVKGFEFETRKLGNDFARYSFVEAMDWSGTVLGRSATVQTFVPHASLAGNCTMFQCQPYTNYGTAPQAVIAIENKYVNV